MALSRLAAAGFAEVGSWSLDDAAPRYSLERERTSNNVLYAFVSKSDVLYVGKTRSELQRRMYQYQRPGPSQRTNIRINGKITEHLKSGRELRIFALPDRGDMEHHGFHLNLAAGLEDSIINEIQPTWNEAGK